MPHGMLNGQQIIFKDYNLSLNVTQLKLQRSDSSTVDKTISVTLNTAGLVKRYVYNSLYNDLISIYVEIKIFCIYMDYYNGSLFISDLEAKLKEKIEKMEVLKLIESNNICHNVLINTLQVEINEVRMQITYHKKYNL